MSQDAKSDMLNCDYTELIIIYNARCENVVYVSRVIGVFCIGQFFSSWRVAPKEGIWRYLCTLMAAHEKRIIVQLLSREILHCVWDPVVLKCAHKRPPLDTVLSKRYPFLIPTPFVKINFNIPLAPPALRNSLPFRFSGQNSINIS
jgi:hypothetical protein